LYIVQLGDIVDYGSHSRECINLAKSLRDEKRISIILGNHERKFQRYCIQKSEGHIRITIKAPIQATIDSVDDDKKTIDNFMTLYSEMSNVLKFKNVYFTHGALHEDVIKTHEYSGIGYQYALYGQIDPNAPKHDGNYPNRIYAWVDKIPNDVKIFVGHDIRSVHEPIVDGNVTFLDTGSGKGGKLSCTVLNLDGSLKEFKRF
jgi:hypothetical protein